MSRHHWTAADVPDQRGRVAVITGGASGLGFETARVLASRGATVVVAGRDPEKGRQARGRIVEEVPDARVELQHLDLASLASVRAAAEELRAAHPALDLLVNNAAVMRVDRRITVDGFELHLATNHLGHFTLTGLLLDRMLGVPGSRVVTLSSADHRRGGPMRVDDPDWTARAYTRTGAYAQSSWPTSSSRTSSSTGCTARAPRSRSQIGRAHV